MSRKLSWVFAVLLCGVICAARAGADDWKASVKKALRNGGAYAEDASGKPLFEHRANDPFIPASTMKLITALVALRVLGPEFRIETEVGLDDRGYLVVRGGGDPMLVSEELAQFAREVRSRIDRCSGLVLDTSFVEPGVTVDGSSETDNPYDAPLGALIVNFNTVAVKKQAGGTILAGEPQTPLTATARARARALPAGNHRVNLKEDGPRYSAELIREFLRVEGVDVPDRLEVRAEPVRMAKRVLTYRSSKPLSEVIRGMLKYSTNFSANQIFLVLGAHQFGAPATMEKGRLVLERELKEILADDRFTVVEGAGLSRRNRVSPRQMVQVVRAFEPYKDLLPEEHNIFRAKTGTLTGVSTLAGMMQGLGNGGASFAVLVNDDVPGQYKFEVAKLLHRGLLTRGVGEISK